MPQTRPFDAREATIASVHSAIFSGTHSCRDVVAAFIWRIESFNPLINAIISLNPAALEEADKLDTLLAAGNATGPLFGIPILLKDNFDAVGLSTTAGSNALRNNVPVEDATTVRALRDAGAIILGKTNLHEFALEGLSVSSLGGQTLNPYDLTRTPGGSSGGSGAAIAASFAVFGTGTDTVNSLRSPASANSLYSFRPTSGLISRAGVIPVSWTQDTVGAIGRCLEDVATALTVMASVWYDPRDGKTANIPDSIKGIDYVRALNTSLHNSNIRIGIVSGLFDRTPSVETDPVNKLMDTAIDMISKMDLQVINIAGTDIFNPPLLANLDVQQFEFREMLDSYLSSSSEGGRPNSMEQLYLSNKGTNNFLVIPAQYNHIRNAMNYSTSDPAYLSKLKRIADVRAKLFQTFSDLKLDAIIYPEQRNLVVPVGSHSQSGRNGILAAVTGCPVITIPIGFSSASNTAPIGIPVGMEILGLPWTEEALLRIAKVVDDHLDARKPPLLDTVDSSLVSPSNIATVPVIQPRGLSNIDLEAYPPGTFGA